MHPAIARALAQHAATPTRPVIPGRDDCPAPMRAFARLLACAAEEAAACDAAIALVVQSRWGGEIVAAAPLPHGAGGCWSRIGGVEVSFARPDPAPSDPSVAPVAIDRADLLANTAVSAGFERLSGRIARLLDGSLPSA